MSSYKYLIIGGGAAGVSTAETIRRVDPTGTMAIVSNEPYLMYSRVMLSKPAFFLGKIPFNEIYMKGKEWYDQNHIDFLGGKKATKCDSTSKTLTLTDGSQITYEKLLIATGVDARKWSAPGSENKANIHSLRTLEDGIAIMEEIKTAKHGITIGGGFISFEMADLLNLAKIETTLILRESYFWEPILDEASGLMIEKALTSAGIKIIKNAEVVMVNGGIVNGSTNNPGPELESDRKENSPAIVSNNDSNTQSPEPITTPGFDSLKPVNTTNQIQGPITSVVVKQTKPDLKEIEIPCEMIIAGIGVTNPTGWLADSGVKTNHGIVSNEFMETSAPDIYTAGDIAEYKDLLLEENVQMGNWVNAREQGRVAGLNMTGSHEAFKFVSFYTTQGCGVNIAFVGDVAPGPDRTVITRGSPEINSYGRIIVVNNEIEGATLINRSAEMTTISKLIEKNMDVSKLHKELGDPNFDLKKLI